MEMHSSAEYPACNFVDASQTNYQSQLLLIECSDGVFQLGYFIGVAGTDQFNYVDRKLQVLKCLAWGYVVHSQYYKE